MQYRLFIIYFTLNISRIAYSAMLFFILKLLLAIIIYLEGFTIEYSRFLRQILQLFRFKLNNAILTSLKPNSIPDSRSFFDLKPKNEELQQKYGAVLAFCNLNVKFSFWLKLCPNNIIKALSFLNCNENLPSWQITKQI